MADKDYLTERIKYLSDALKLACVFLIAIGGGTISLLLGELSTAKTVLAALGASGIIILVAFSMALDRKIRLLIQELKKVHSWKL